MTASFLDTTVLIHFVEPGNSLSPQTERFVYTHQPAQVSYYAFRELLTGRVRLLCEVHNAILSANDPGEALLALSKRADAEGRKKGARIEEVARILSQLFSQHPNRGRDEMKREALEALALRAGSLWARARRHSKLVSVQNLACFNEGKLSFGDAGELRGPSGSFNCVSTQKCAAAGYMYDRKEDIKKLVDALHPSKLDERLARKNETTRRRAALKELLNQGPEGFEKMRCRALGDAYFAVMCPPGAVVASTNIVDFEPLCKALKKTLIKP